MEVAFIVPSLAAMVWAICWMVVRCKDADVRVLMARKDLVPRDEEA